jgi:hypothetical protein
MKNGSAGSRASTVVDCRGTPGPAGNVKEFPLARREASFTIDQAMEKLKYGSSDAPAGGGPALAFSCSLLFAADEMIE